MPDPTIRSVSTSVNSNVVALPAGYDSANDILVFYVGTVGGSITPPTNVSLISGLQGTFTGWRQEAFESRVALTGNQTFNTGGAYTDIWCVCIQDADRSVTPVGTNATGNGTTATMSSVAVAVANSLLLLGSVSSVGARSAGPGGMSAASGSPIDSNFYVDYETVDPSSTGTRSSTYGSGQDWIMQGVVVAAQETAVTLTADSGALELAGGAAALNYDSAGADLTASPGALELDGLNAILAAPAHGSHVATTLQNSLTSTTSATITISASCQAGDYLIVPVVNRDATAEPSVTDDDTGGNAWARLDTGADGLTVWWKRATSGTAGKTITCSGVTGSIACLCTVMRGFAFAENVTKESNISGNETHAGVTPTRNNSWIFLIVANRTNDLAVATQAATNPTTLTERGEVLNTGGSDCAVVLATSEQVGAAGATGNITWAQTNAVTISCTFDLVPTRSLGMHADPDALALTGQAATLNFSGDNNTLVADSAALEIDDAAAALRAGRKVAATTGALEIDDTAAALSHGVLVSAEAFEMAVAGTDVTLRHGYTMAAATAALETTGQVAALRAARKLVAATAALELTGQAAALLAGAILAVDPTALALDDVAAALVHGYRLTGVSTGLELDDVATGLSHGYRATAETRALALGQTAVLLSAARRLAAVTAALEIDDIAVIFSWARRMAADTRALALTGQDAGLVFAAGNTLIASPGALDLDDVAATLGHGYRLAAVTAALALNDVATALVRSRPPAVATTTALELTGQQAALSHAYRMLAASTALELAGPNTGLMYGSNVTLVAESLALALTGQAATLLAGNAPLTAEPGVIDLLGGDAALRRALAVLTTSAALEIAAPVTLLSHGLIMPAAGAGLAVDQTDVAFAVVRRLVGAGAPLELAQLAAALVVGALSPTGPYVSLGFTISTPRVISLSFARSELAVVSIGFDQ